MRLSSGADIAREKERLGIADAEGLKGLVMIEEIEMQIRQRHLGIEVIAGAAIAHRSARPRAWRRKASRNSGNCSRRMVRPAAISWPPNLTRQPEHMRQRFDHREALDAAAAALSQAGFVEADDERRPVISLAEPGCDDAEHAGMPSIARRRRWRPARGENSFPTSASASR